MARPRGRDGRLDLSPRARLIGGWLAALVIVLGIAAGVRIFGGNADGTAPLASAAASIISSPVPITFGTELGGDRIVPSAARGTRFAPGDTFAYAVPDADPATSVYVEVERVSGGTAEVVQAPVEAQLIPGGPATIGFTVPADRLFEAFGPGIYRMRIFLEPDGAPIADGRFELVDPTAPVPTPSEQPD